jgi:hypothetical protein
MERETKQRSFTAWAEPRRPPHFFATSSDTEIYAGFFA